MCLPGHIRHCEPVVVRRSIDRRGSCPGGRYQDPSVGTESRLRGAHGRRYAVSLCMYERRSGTLDAEVAWGLRFAGTVCFSLVNTIW